jgi:two-component system, NarL family, invasion response regulator UvrY
MHRILIVDDHPIVRRGLRDIVLDQTGYLILEASSGAEVLDLVRREQISVVLLDISMPGRNGLETLQDLKREHPKLPVIMLTIYPEDQYAIRALKAGADGYLTKDSAPDELVSALAKVLNGGKYVSTALAERLAGEVRRDSDKLPHEQLSDREYEVFRHLGSGMTLTEIAEKLSLSIKTVSTYRTRILEKMQMQTNSDIVRYVFHHKLID